MRLPSALGVSGVCAAMFFWSAGARPIAAAEPLTMATLSARADLVSGGDVLVEIRPASTAPVSVKVNDRDVSQAFRRDETRRSYVGLVEGLNVGRNALVARVGSQTARLDVTNHPITGPILSGEHLKPFQCNTVQGLPLASPVVTSTSASRS